MNEADPGGPEHRRVLVGRRAPAPRPRDQGLFMLLPPLPATRGTVLLVDDDVVIASTFALLLNSHGWLARTAGTVRQAHEEIDAAPLDCLVLDLMLADGDGTELLQHVRGRWMPTRTVVITGATDRTVIQRVGQWHPDEMLSKPFSFEELERALVGPTAAPPATSLCLCNSPVGIPAIGTDAATRCA